MTCFCFVSVSCPKEKKELKRVRERLDGYQVSASLRSFKSRTTELAVGHLPNCPALLGVGVNNAGSKDFEYRSMP